MKVVILFSAFSVFAAAIFVGGAQSGPTVTDELTWHTSHPNPNSDEYFCLQEESGLFLRAGTTFNETRFAGLDLSASTPAACLQNIFFQFRLELLNGVLELVNRATRLMVGKVRISFGGGSWDYFLLHDLDFSSSGGAGGADVSFAQSSAKPSRYYITSGNSLMKNTEFDIDGFKGIGSTYVPLQAARWELIGLAQHMTTVAN